MKKKKIPTWLISIVAVSILVTVSILINYNGRKIENAIVSFNDNVYEYLPQMKPIYKKYSVTEGSTKDEFHSMMDGVPYHVTEVKTSGDNSEIFYITENADKTCFVTNGMGLYCDSDDLKETMMFMYAKDFIINDDITAYNNSLSKTGISNMRINHKYTGGSNIELYNDEYEDVLTVGYANAKFVKRHTTYIVDVETETFIKK